MKFKAVWTGEYPNLCHGEWQISYNRKKLNVPKEVKKSHMNTLGEYEEWSFDDDWLEQFNSYMDGEDCDTWIEINEHWIKTMLSEANIEYTIELAEELFYEIQSQDWRHGSCGGCI